MKNCKYARLGYDPESRCIGLDLFPNVAADECLSLRWGAGRTTATCSIRSLLSHSGLSLKGVAGTYTYNEEQLQGPVEIPGFSDHGYLQGPIVGGAIKRKQND